MKTEYQIKKRIKKLIIKSNKHEAKGDLCEAISCNQEARGLLWVLLK